MVTFTVRSHVGKDGLLNLKVPVGVRDTDVEVVVVLQPQSVQAHLPKSDDYPDAFFNDTFASLPELQEIESEGTYEIREELG